MVILATTVCSAVVSGDDMFWWWAEVVVIQTRRSSGVARFVDVEQGRTRLLTMHASRFVAPLRRSWSSRSMTQLSKPVIAVIGTTGTGKSQLAIDLCLALAAKQPDVSPWTNGRVINADAMQVYKGLDIATNKVTEEEMCGVAHRLMDIKDPTEEYFITQWIRDANKEVGCDLDVYLALI